MFDAQTEVVGMTTAGSDSKTQERKVYAIPIKQALAIVEQVRAGDESGTVVNGPKAFLGIVVKDSTDGILLTTVEAGSPAAKVGLKAGTSCCAWETKPSPTGRSCPPRSTASSREPRRSPTGGPPPGRRSPARSSSGRVSSTDPARGESPGRAGGTPSGWRRAPGNRESDAVSAGSSASRR